jgi:hypothetical protein
MFSKKLPTEERKRRTELLRELYRLPKHELKRLGQESLEKAERENYDMFSLSKKLNLVAWILIIILFTFYGVLGYLDLDSILNNFNPSNISILAFLISLILTYIAIPIQVTTTVALIGFKSNPINLILDPLAIPRYLKRSSIFSLVSVVIYIISILYLIGFVDLLFAFLSKEIFPGLSSLANMISANLVSWILSGVIGNFIYDMLKKMVSKENKHPKS